MLSPLEQLIEQIEAVTLDDINAQIESIDQQLVAVVEPLQKRRDTLIAMRRIVDARTNGAPQRKPRAKRGERSEQPAARQESPEIESSLPSVEKVRAFLNVMGPSPVTQIAEGTKLNYATVHSLCNRRTDLFIPAGKGQFGLK